MYWARQETEQPKTSVSSSSGIASVNTRVQGGPSNIVRLSSFVKKKIIYIKKAYFFFIYTLAKFCPGLVRELNPGPLAPEARIIPLDQQARMHVYKQQKYDDSGGIRTHALSDWCLKPAP